jgi:two-component system sensor histidine kinase NreB
LTRALEGVRALSHDLRPAILEDFGLGAALRAYADDWTRTFRVPIRLEVPPDGGDRLPADVEIALFRVAQEALMNAGKYAGAREVRVSLALAEGGVRLGVEDDGVGFDPEGLPGPTREGGMGLYGMREWAALLGGHLTIEASPGRGTRITLQAPLS